MARWDINIRHLKAGVVVDTNLFLLLLIGTYDVSKIGLFRATQKYNRNIYEILLDLVSVFRIVHCTTNVVTEVDNLSRQVAKTEWTPIGDALEAMVSRSIETVFGSANLLAHPKHRQIGMTDCSILELAQRDVLVITDDLPLTTELTKRHCGVINLSHYIAH